MSIMERLRSSTDSTPMQVVLILIVIAFLGWTQLPQGQTVQVAAVVNGERVLEQEFRQRFAVEQAFQGGKLAPEAEAALVAQVKQTLARETAVAQEAERLGFDVSPWEVSRLIKADPAFANEAGKFDYARFEDAVKGWGRSRAEFEADFRDELLRSRLRFSVVSGVSVPVAELKERYAEQFSTSDLEYVKLPPELAAINLAPTPEEVEAFLTTNVADIQARYDADKAALYEKRDQVTLRMISLAATDSDRDAMKGRLDDVRKTLAAGADFSAAARRWSEDSSAPAGGDLGEKVVDALTKVVRDALADVPVGQISAVVDEGDRVAIYEVVGREPARIVPIEEVRDGIAFRLLRDQKAKTWAEDLAANWNEVPPMALMNQVGAMVLPMPQVSVQQYGGGPGRPPASLVKKAAGAQAGTVLGAASSPTESGEEWYVVRLISNNEADPQYFEPWKQQAAMEARNAAWEAYVDELMSRATVDVAGGEAVTGGWQDWLDGILPK
jgi:peptidyl-prolyl cis-trans isomerase D